MRHGLQLLGASCHPGYCLLDPRARATYHAGGTRKRARPLPTGGMVIASWERGGSPRVPVGAMRVTSQPAWRAARDASQVMQGTLVHCAMVHGRHIAWHLRDSHARHATQRPMRTTGSCCAALPRFAGSPTAAPRAIASRRGGPMAAPPIRKLHQPAALRRFRFLEPRRAPAPADRGIHQGRRPVGE